jgi:phenylacetate-CoA ligase
MALRARLLRAPAWRARLREAGLSPKDLGSLADLDAFPTTDRDQYARDWQGLCDLDGDPELHVATSSGTTGQALLALRSGFDGVYMWAVLRHWIETLGVGLPSRPKLVLLCALPGGLEYSVRTPHFLGGALHRISTQRPRALERLARSAPAVLSTDPAGLRWLLAQPRLPKPALVLSSAQRLGPSLRAEAEAALGAPIVNYYATTETGPIAWECLIEAGRFHVLHPDVWVESLAAGQLAVTRLRPSPLPLLRYLTGDAGTVSDGRCACGAAGRSIVGFAGRERADFLAPDGSAVDAWSLSWLFKDLPLVRFEMTQVGAQSFEVRLEGPLPLDAELLCLRLRRVLRRLGFAAPWVAVREASLPAKPTPFRRLWP